MSLEKFLAVIGEHSVAEQNRYLVEITPPLALAQNASLASPKEGAIPQVLSLYCTGANLPESTFNIAQRYTYGMPKPVVTTKVNPTALAFDFYLDRDMNVKRFWDMWHEFIYTVDNRGEDRFMLTYPDEYMSTISISQLDRSGYVVYKVRLYNAFPKMISDVKLDAQSNGMPATLQVTIEYQYWNEVVVVEQPEVPKKIDRGIMGEIGQNLSKFIGSIDQTFFKAKSELKKLTSFSF